MAAGDALHPEQFRMQTNIKAAPGSQGTLFQGGYQTRYPRGYTPERLRAVTESAKWLDPQRTYKPHAPSTAAMRDTVARSTVPIEHINGVHFTATPHAANELESIDARGVYKAPGSTALTGGLIKVHPEAVREMTPIHEIGHHVSHVIEKTEHSAYDTPERRGTEEGYAENYADTHFRDRRGKQQRSDLGPGGWAGREETMAASAAVRDTFQKKRKESPLHEGSISQAEIDAMSPRQRGLPPQHVEGQVPLLDKVGSSGGGYVERYEGGVRNKREPRHWDYTIEDEKRGLKRERN